MQSGKEKEQLGPQCNKGAKPREDPNYRGRERERDQTIQTSISVLFLLLLLLPPDLESATIIWCLKNILCALLKDKLFFSDVLKYGPFPFCFWPVFDFALDQSYVFFLLGL